MQLTGTKLKIRPLLGIEIPDVPASAQELPWPHDASDAHCPCHRCMLKRAKEADDRFDRMARDNARG